jgi:hypothetical protein
LRPKVFCSRRISGLGEERKLALQSGDLGGGLFYKVFQKLISSAQGIAEKI